MQTFFTKDVEGYNCKFCMKSFTTAASLVKHIRLCPRNPETKGCRTCAHYKSTLPKWAREYKRECLIGFNMEFIHINCKGHKNKSL